LLASRHPLAELFTDTKNGQSDFWNIFGHKYELGLLSKQAAAQLIEMPLQHSLNRTVPDRSAIFYYAGCHPAFIQMVMTEYWLAYQGGFEPRDDVIKQNLRLHFISIICE
jgi:hypothetical protein